MGYEWDFAAVFQYRALLWVGLQNTILIGFTCLTPGLFFGRFVGAARFSGRWWLYYPAAIFVEVFRNTPVLVQIMWFFFAFPILVPFQIDAFSAATLGLTLNTVAFSSEIYRAGLQSVERGLWEAGRALGMTFWEQLRRIVLPISVRRMLPAFAKRGVELFKMTSLASVIAYGELIHQAKTISTIAFNPIKMYTADALIFFVLLFPMTVLVRRFETRNDPRGR